MCIWDQTTHLQEVMHVHVTPSHQLSNLIYWNWYRDVHYKIHHVPHLYVYV